MTITLPTTHHHKDDHSTGGNRKIVSKVSYLSIFVIAIFTIQNLVTNDFQEVTRKLLSSSLQEESTVTTSSGVKRKTLKEIRYATFGTSISWGSGIENRTDAFIYQLSPKASNFAIPASGAEYPSKCLTSMIGEQVFDVIILEFTGRVNKATFSLARRLRERFPDALIISLKNWVPNMINSKVFKMDVMSLAQKYDFPGHFMHDPLFHEFIKQLGNEDWKINWRDSDEIEKDMEEKLGVKVLPLAQNFENPHSWLSHSKRFSKDSFHLSEEGHKDIAERIEKVIKEVGIPNNPRLNEFSNKDICKSWFLTGEPGEDVKYGKRVILHPLATNEKKHVLSFPSPGGAVTLTNKSDKKQHLYISYMTSGPLPSLYPKASVKIVGTDMDEVILDPNPPGNWGDKYIHMPKEAYIGEVDSGDVTLLFRTSLQEPDTKKHPFALVSYAFSPQLVEE